MTEGDLLIGGGRGRKGDWVVDRTGAGWWTPPGGSRDGAGMVQAYAEKGTAALYLAAALNSQNVSIITDISELIYYVDPRHIRSFLHIVNYIFFSNKL